MPIIRGANAQDGRANMKGLNNYIDRCLIEEYGIRNPKLNGYELDLDDVPEREVSNFLHELMCEDTNVRDYVRDQMQKLINQRLHQVTLEVTHAA